MRIWLATGDAAGRWSRPASCCIVVCVLWAIAVVPGSAGGPLTKIQLNGPSRIALDSDGNLYVYEDYGHRLVRLDFKRERAETIAGNGQKCCYREGAHGQSTSIYHVYSVAIDAQNNVYIGGRNRRDDAFVRVLDAKTGRIRTLANGKLPAPATGVRSMQADLSDPRGLAVESDGTPLVSADGSDLIAELGENSTCLAGGKVSITSGQKPDCKIKADFRGPTALALSAQNKLYVADYYRHRVVRIDLNKGTVAVVAGNGSHKTSGDGGLATEAGVPFPFAIAVDRNENLYIVENGGGTVRKVDAVTGIILTVAGTGKLGYSGDGGPAHEADMNPLAIAVDNDSNIYLADVVANRIRMVDKAGAIRTVAGNGQLNRPEHIE